MSGHLLSLADLHVAAPGVLDVVFGPDGDFEGAPRFTGPVRYRSAWLAVLWLAQGTSADGEPTVEARTRDANGTGAILARLPLDELTLDCRVRSGAARLLDLLSFVDIVDFNAPAGDIAEMFRALAPEIAALRGAP